MSPLSDCASYLADLQTGSLSSLVSSDPLVSFCSPSYVLLHLDLQPGAMADIQFDTFNHSTVHWSMTLVFVVGVALSAIFQSAEIVRLSLLSEASGLYADPLVVAAQRPP